MNALARFVACASVVVCATAAIGCDNRSVPVVDTTRTTGADLNALVSVDAGVSALAVPSLRPQIEIDEPVVRVTPANGAYAAPAPNLAGERSTPTTTRTNAAPPAPATVAPTPSNSNNGNSGDNDFVGSSFGPAPVAPYDVTPPSPPSDNHGNGTLGSSTGSHAFDTERNP